MTRDETKALLAMIQAIYPNFRPEDRTASADAWTLMLEEYGNENVVNALKMYVRANKTGFPPSPGQLIEKINQISSPRCLDEGEAWAMVRKALRNSGYHSDEEFVKLPPEVQRAVGMPSRLRDMALDENFDEGVESSNFMRAFRDARDSADVRNLYPDAINRQIDGANSAGAVGRIEQLRKEVCEKIEKRTNVAIEEKGIGADKTGMSEETRNKYEMLRKELA